MISWLSWFQTETQVKQAQNLLFMFHTSLFVAFVAVDKNNNNNDYNLIKCTETSHLLTACLWVVFACFINFCIDLYHQHT